nr:hepcidin-magainin [synthetic construct]
MDSHISLCRWCCNCCKAYKGCGFCCRFGIGKFLHSAKKF